MTKIIEVPAGRFRYAFLDEFRRDAPRGYILLDRAIDLVGFKSRTIPYLKMNAHFTDCGNVPPSNKQKGAWRIRHVKSTEIYSVEGQKYYFTKGKKSRGNSTDKEIAAPPLEAVQFRKAAWDSLMTMIKNREVSANCLHSTGAIETIANHNLHQLLKQRNLVQNTGCMWLTNLFGKDTLTLLILKKSQLIATLEGQPEIADEFENLDDNDLPVAPQDILELWAKSILRYCVANHKFVSRDGLRVIVSELISKQQRPPSKSSWKTFCAKLESDPHFKALCRRGNRNSVVKDNGTGLKEFLKEFRKWDRRQKPVARNR